MNGSVDLKATLVFMAHARWVSVQYRVRCEIAGPAQLGGSGVDVVSVCGWESIKPLRTWKTWGSGGAFEGLHVEVKSIIRFSDLRLPASKGLRWEKDPTPVGCRAKGRMHLAVCELVSGNISRFGQCGIRSPREAAFQGWIC